MLRFVKKRLGQTEIVSRLSQHVFTIHKVYEQHGQEYYNVEGKDRP